MTLYINSQGWRVDDVTTIEQCDQALIYLEDSIMVIKGQLEEPHRGKDWRTKATYSLRLKHQALTILRRRRHQLADETLRICAHVKQHHPNIYAEALNAAR